MPSIETHSGGRMPSIETHSEWPTLNLTADGEQAMRIIRYGSVVTEANLLSLPPRSCTHVTKELRLRPNEPLLADEALFVRVLGETLAPMRAPIRRVWRKGWEIRGPIAASATRLEIHAQSHGEWDGYLVADNLRRYIVTFTVTRQPLPTLEPYSVSVYWPTLAAWRAHHDGPPNYPPTGTRMACARCGVVNAWSDMCNEFCSLECSTAAGTRGLLIV